MNYRNNLSGCMMYKSFIVPPISGYIISADEKKLAHILTLFNNLNRKLEGLPAERVSELIRTEAYDSCRLSEDRNVNPLSFSVSADNENADNIVKAVDYATEALNELPISTRLIRNIHYIICRSRDYDKKYRGEYRNSPTWIGRPGAGLSEAIFVPPVHEDMTAALSDLENYLNYSTDNVFVKAAVFHYQFEMIHPFIDGNGRTGRLLNTLFLADTGVLSHPVLLLSHTIARGYNSYCEEIQHVHETGDISVWIDYWLDVLTHSARYTIQTIENMDNYG